MRIVIGLGNPGREYASTRHNIGFMVIDELAQRCGVITTRNRFRSELIESTLDGEKLILAKPQTYMNLSGTAAREILNWYHVPRKDLLVVLDDMDLPFGQLRMRARGSAGGHNGLTSIIEQLGGNDIPRLRVGIGRGRSTSIGHVLSRFSKDEERELPDVIDRAASGVLRWAREGIVSAMNDLNRRPADEPASPVVRSSS
jgi:PTH1 family peptidyl-tRNA hydrolase